MNRLLVSVLLVAAFHTTSFAQKTMLMGKITGADGIPLPGAGIYLKGEQDKTAVIADNMGLFTSRLLPEGEYEVTIVSSNNRELTAGKIHLSSTAAKKYYHFIFNGNKVTTTTTGTNPYMEAKLSQIEASDRWLNFPLHGTMYHIDNSGKVIKIVSEIEPVNPKR